VFERFLSGQEADAALFDQTAIIDTEIWKALFDFQKDGVKGAIHKINQHNGCILADSVGLGKSYSALAVIKYHELRNHRVLVLCPKKLRDNWTVYLAQNNSELNPFLKDRFAYTVLSHTDLSRDSGRVDGIDLATLNWGNFDLIVIDESHNFRNNTSLLARVVQVFGAAHAHHGYLFANVRANRIKLVVHDGFGVWCATRRLHLGGFVWPRQGAAGASCITLTREQFDALVLGLPWQRLEQLKTITRM
jgi:SNF2 family DNA or RNA helicase